MDASISELWVYPIKSCKGFSVEQVYIDKRGILFDRCWMIGREEEHETSSTEAAATTATILSSADTSLSRPPLRFITSRQVPKMALIQPEIDSYELISKNGTSNQPCTLRLSAPGMPTLVVHSIPDGYEAPPAQTTKKSTKKSTSTTTSSVIRGKKRDSKTTLNSSSSQLESEIAAPTPTTETTATAPGIPVVRDRRMAIVWSDTVPCIDEGDEAAQWVSEYITRNSDGPACAADYGAGSAATTTSVDPDTAPEKARSPPRYRLLRQSGPVDSRVITKQPGFTEYPVSLADGFPYMLLSEQSITGLRLRIAASMASSSSPPAKFAPGENTSAVLRSITVRRFRPNFLVSHNELAMVRGSPMNARRGTRLTAAAGPEAAHAEDSWHRIRIGSASRKLTFRSGRLCSRCRVIAVDPETGVITDSVETFQGAGSSGGNSTTTESASSAELQSIRRDIEKYVNPSGDLYEPISGAGVMMSVPDEEGAPSYPVPLSTLRSYRMWKEKLGPFFGVNLVREESGDAESADKEDFNFRDLDSSSEEDEGEDEEADAEEEADDGDGEGDDDMSGINANEDNKDNENGTANRIGRDNKDRLNRKPVAARRTTTKTKSVKRTSIPREPVSSDWIRVGDPVKVLSKNTEGWTGHEWRLRNKTGEGQKELSSAGWRGASLCVAATVGLVFAVATGLWVRYGKGNK